MKPLIVGIASLPDRADCLFDTVKSLYDQVDKIIIGLNNYNEVPDFLKMKKVECYLLDNSLGDAAKFYKIDDYKNHYYFACDDDLIYPDNFCETLISKSKKYNSIVGVHGAKISRPVNSYYRDRKVYHTFDYLPQDVEVDVVGTGCCLIDTSILDLKLSDFKVPNMADIWLADTIKKQKLKSYVIQRGPNWIKYHPKMKGKWTIFDDFVGKKDVEQTKIASKW